MDGIVYLEDLEKENLLKIDLGQGRNVSQDSLPNWVKTDYHHFRCCVQVGEE